MQNDIQYSEYFMRGYYSIKSCMSEIVSMDDELNNHRYLLTGGNSLNDRVVTRAVIRRTLARFDKMLRGLGSE